MLVLSRKPGERIRIGGGVCLTVLRVRGNSVRLGFEAPAQVPITREELGPAAHPGGRGPADRAERSSGGP
ncbi:MAG TPA: carbon storage regulator [Isosphaeraceae bacterium]